MCGFLILKSNNFTKESKKSFLKSLNFLKRRGPDETKVLIRKKFLIGFTRLSINDHKTASQPFISNCKKYIIVFNGEIINYKYLQRHLIENNFKIKYGHEAEIIVNLYKLYGKNVIKHLRGFFSFVIINTKTNKIFAAVDRYSIKPLYYSKNLNGEKKTLLLTSDYSSALKGGLIQKKLNYDKLVDFFVMGREFDNSTILLGIKKLRSASTLIINKGIKINKYWKPFKRGINYKKSPKKIIKDFDDNFAEVLNSWKIADTRLSLALSSGVDSQLIKTYFDEKKIVAKNFHMKEIKNDPKIDNSCKIIKPDIKKIIHLINAITKESFNIFAFAHPSSTALLQIYNSIRKNNYRVTFCGEGADELLGGYSRFKKQVRILKNEKISLSSMYLKLYSKEIRNFSYAFKNKKYDTYKILKDKISSINLSSRKFENKVLEFDQLTFIPPLTERHDIIGMYNSLEVRPPYLDHKLAKFANNLHPKHKLDPNKKSKNISYNLFTKITGNKILNKKIGTPSYFDQILKNKKELIKFKKSISCRDMSKLFDIERVKKLINEPKTSRIFLWRLYMFSKILNNFQIK